jgi:hypothetical protein
MREIILGLTLLGLWGIFAVYLFIKLFTIVYYENAGVPPATKACSAHECGETLYVSDQWGNTQVDPTG